MSIKYLFIIIPFVFFSCKKEDKCPLDANLTKEQQIKLLADVAKMATPNDIIPAEDRAFLNEIRVIANDIHGLYDGVTESMTLEEKYIQLKHNIRQRADDVEAKALVHYNGSQAYTIMAKNSFVLMTYDALQRNIPEMLWTNLGIFAANEVRSGVVLAYNVSNYLEKNNIELPETNGESIKDILIGSTVILLEGQINVVVDIGALVLMNKYVDRDLEGETWLSKEAIKGFRLQKQAEAALKNCDKEGYQDYQTLAAIQFGIHEQAYILQPIWDKPLLQQLSKINEAILNITNGGYGVFGEIFLGANKVTETTKGYNIKIPKGAYNLYNLDHRVQIAMNGFNTYNRLRKDKDWAYWINYSQIRLGYAVDVYYNKDLEL